MDNLAEFTSLLSFFVAYHTIFWCNFYNFIDFRMIFDVFDFLVESVVSVFVDFYMAAHAALRVIILYSDTS